MEKIFTTVLFVTLFGAFITENTVRICNGYTFDFKCELLGSGRKDDVVKILAIGLASSKNIESLASTTGEKVGCGSIQTECRAVVHNMSDTSQPENFRSLLQSLRDVCDGNSTCPLSIPPYDDFSFVGAENCDTPEIQYLKQVTVQLKCSLPTRPPPTTTAPTPLSSTAQTGTAKDSTTQKIPNSTREEQTTQQAEKTTEDIDNVPVPVEDVDKDEKDEHDRHDHHDHHEHGKASGQGVEVTTQGGAAIITINCWFILGVLLAL